MTDLMQPVAPTAGEPVAPAGVRDYRPGSIRFQNTWFPLVHARRLRRSVIRRAIHGEPVFVWRDQRGVLQAAAAGPADMERGQWEGSRFTDEVGHYPVVDRYGYAWVWYGDPALAATMPVPDIGSHLPVTGQPRHMEAEIAFNCSYELVCENLLDLTHADFLHPAVAGTALSDDDDVTVTSTAETVAMTRLARGRPVPVLQRRLVKSDRQDLRGVTEVHVRSGLCLVEVEFEGFARIRLVHPANPESNHLTRSPVTFNVDRCVRPVRHIFPFVAHMIARQDNFALAPQNRHYVGASDGKDLSSRFDRAGLRYRKAHQDLVHRQSRGDLS
jgi:hypothetical protein